MQSINVTVITPGFMLALFGTAAIALMLGIGAISHWGQTGPMLILAASALYLIGCIGVTIHLHWTIELAYLREGC